MTQAVSLHSITMHETQGCLVVPIQEELSKTSANVIQKKILERIQAKPVIGVVIDLSGVQIIDAALWQIFVNTTRMIEVMGLSAVLTGLNPGTVASIIDLQLNCDTVKTAMHLEDALNILVQNNSLQSLSSETAAEPETDAQSVNDTALFGMNF